MTPENLTAYALLLDDVPTDELAEAIIDWAKNRKWFPAVAELRLSCPSVPDPDDPMAWIQSAHDQAQKDL